MKKVHDITSNHVSCDTLYEYWQYFCGVMQVIALILVGILMVFMIFGGVSIQIVTNMGAPTASSGSPYSRLSNIADLEYSEITNLLSNENSTVVKEAKEETVRKIFDYYADENECMDYDEFSDFVNDSLQAEEQFALMDINNDEVIGYDELVYLLTQLEAMPLLKSDDITDSLKEIFGDEYSDEHEAEFLAEIFFQEMDVDEENVITKEAYIEYEINQEWEEYNSNGDECVSYTEFIAVFFESQFYKTLQEIQSEISNEEFDIDAVIGKIKDAQTEDVEEMDLLFEPHQFDEQIESTKRRLIWWWWWRFRLQWWFFPIIRPHCFGDNGLANVLGDSLKPLRELKIGDFIFDGEEYSKIFYIFKSSNDKIKMKKISFGNPNFDNSLTLTSGHLLYKQGHSSPIPCGDIKVGDILSGIDNNTDYIYDMYFGNDYNYTVYDMSTIYETPIAPITNSGNLVVNGVKASSYSVSVCQHDVCHEAGAIFRWISDNIDEQMAVNMIDFFHYKFQQQSNGQVELIGNTAVMSMILCAIGVPVICTWFIAKVVYSRFSKTSKKKAD